MASGIRYTNEEFIKKSKYKHNNKYDYSLVEYKNAHVKIKIICPIHDIFEQLPYQHLNGHGCKKCSDKENGKNKTKKGSNFIKDCINIHGNKYDYSLVKYINSNTKIKIICPIHGIFEQKPSAHFNSEQGCPNCANNIKLTTNHFIKKSKVVHDDKYDYSLVKYINSRTKVKIICKEHGIFEQIPTDHVRNIGCPKCNISKNEIKIQNYLESKNIKFVTQKTFDGCKYKRKLKFDFYIPEKNICIEYDGEQHFEKYRFEKNDDKLNIRKLRDTIKTNFCKDNNITLIRIKYDEDISEKIKNIIL